MSLLSLSAVMALLAIPSQVVWSYLAFGVVLAIGLVTIFLRGDWQKARGFDTLIVFGPLFYAAPLAAFGTEHFTLTEAIASIIPAWIWYQVWAYFVGACFIVAALGLVTRIQASLSASLLALTFFLFVVLMDAPGWAQNPRDRFALTLALRELSFSGLWRWQRASPSGGASAPRTSVRRLRDTSLQFPCCFSASSNSCMAITFPAFR